MPGSIERQRDSGLREGEAPAEPPARPQRRHPAHGVTLGAGASTIVFLTVCTKDRSPWLGTEACHAALRSAWSAADPWLVGSYVILPDHLHLFAAPRTEQDSLESWVRFWKSRFRREHQVASHRFQTDHWDTRLRSGESYEEKWYYVKNNPVRHGLVARAEDWPFQGTLNDLPW